MSNPASENQQARGPSWHVFIYAGESSGPVEDTFPLGFDTVYTKLESTEFLFIEPDGSFVWREFAEGGGLVGQIDGVLSERADRLAFVEVKGDSIKLLETLLADLGFPKRALTVEWVSQGQRLSAEEFLAQFDRA